MVFIGQIEAESESTSLDVNEWLTLIESHASLRHVPPYQGINPFTREPCEYRAPASAARITANGNDIGSISAATDDSPVLIVEARHESVEAVLKVAEDVARTLGARFVRDPEA